MRKLRLGVIFGTRPEAIKMAPVVASLTSLPGVVVDVILTGQHKDMLAQVLDIFEITASVNLNLMTESQTLESLTAKCLTGVSNVLKTNRYDGVLVHGDTTTSFAGALAAFYNHVPVFHVEAGLRTGNRRSPWPEEMNRSLTGRVAELHFAPTDEARSNLVSEGVDPESVYVVGNTVIDALRWAVDLLEGYQPKETVKQVITRKMAGGRFILVTGHRRENFGAGLQNICLALKEIALRGDVEIIYPVHLNPKVKGVVNEMLGGETGIHLIPPVDYLDFIYLLEKCDLVLTDSGGIQEEAPHLGKPVLVMRDTTERPEGLRAGTSRLVGSDPDQIVSATWELLDDPNAYNLMARAINPYGDGHAAARIGEAVMAFFDA